MASLSLQRGFHALHLQIAGAMLAWLQLTAQAGETTISGSHTAAVVQTVWGILGYTRWPGDPAAIQLCIAGETPHASALLDGGELPGGRKVLGRRIRSDERQPLAGCHALYGGKLRVGEWTQLMAAWPSGQPLLTLSEDALNCQSGGVFCLDTSANAITFELNLDSMARSGVRVNPRVLGLARRKEGN